MIKKNKVIYSDLILGSVTECELSEGFPALIIDHLHCKAKVSFYGGQVLSWQPTNEKEVFWLSKSSLYQQGKAIRGGIPLCWPWFGPKEGTVQHGFVRQALWQFTLLEVSDEGVSIELSWQGEQVDEQWPYHVKLEQRLFFGKTFKQTLSITNLSSTTFEYTGALHSYFNVSNPENVTTPLLNNSAFTDKLTGQKVESLRRDNTIGPIDTVYENNQPQQVIDSEWERTITITNTNTEQWVLWNPGFETASNMLDVHDNGENEFVCLEAAITENTRVEAQQTVVIGQVVEVCPLMK